MGNPSENKIKIEPEDSEKNDEITDVLLIKEDDSPDLNKDDKDIVYTLVENQKPSTEENSETQMSYAEKIAQLQQVQDSMGLDLEDAFAASDELARELRKVKQTKKPSVTSYIALTIAGLALIITTIAALFLGSLQSDVTQLTTAIENLETRKHEEEDVKYIHARLDDLVIKTDRILAEKVDNALQNKPTEPDPKPVSSITNDEIVDKQKKDPLKTVINTETDKKVISNKVDKEKTTSLSKSSPPVVLKRPVSKNKSVTPKPKVKKEWAVALGSYKNASTAKKNAHKYQQQGIPTTVIKVNTQGQVWHRLLTKAFASQQEATRYTAEVKRKLKIESVLVTKR